MNGSLRDAIMLELLRGVAGLDSFWLDLKPGMRDDFAREVWDITDAILRDETK